MAHSDETYRTEVMKYLVGRGLRVPNYWLLGELSEYVKKLYPSQIGYVTHDKYWWPTEVFERLKYAPEDPAKEGGKSSGSMKFVKVDENHPDVTIVNSAGEPIDLTKGVVELITPKQLLENVLGYKKEEGMKEGKLRKLLEKYGKRITESQITQSGQIVNLTHQCLSLFKNSNVWESMRLLGYIQGFLRACGYLTDKEIEEDLKPRDPKQVTIDYTNYKGERRKREVIPVNVLFTSNEWHKQPQWLLYAYDVEEGNKEKTFAIKDIHSWTPNGDD